MKIGDKVKIINSASCLFGKKGYIVMSDESDWPMVLLEGETKPMLFSPNEVIIIKPAN